LSPWTSRTLDARRGALSTNSLPGLDAPLTCASSRQTPSSHNSGRTGHTMAGRRESTRTGMRVSTRTWRRESARLVNKNLSHLWKVPRRQGCSIFDLFRPKELSAALMCLKPGKSPGLDSIFLEFTLNTRPAFKSWFCDFLISCMRHLKIPKIVRRALIVAFQKQEEPLGPKELTPYISAVFPFKIPKRLIHAHVEPIIAPTGAVGLSSQVVGRRPGHCMADLYNIRPAKVFLAAHESFLNSRKCCKSSTSTE